MRRAGKKDFILDEGSLENHINWQENDSVIALRIAAERMR
jgi:hypothetical protein